MPTEQYREYGVRSGSCVIHLDEDDESSVKIDMSEEGEEKSEQSKLAESLNAAIDEFDSIGTRSKTFGYVSSPESMMSMDRMNENYDLAMHYMARFLISDIKVGIPSIALLVSYPNTVCKSVPLKMLRFSSLSNVFLLSIPNPVTVKYDTIITPSSRSRLVVNIPTVVLRVLKGVDFVPSQTSALKDTITLPSESEQALLDNFSYQRFLGVGEILCSVRVAM